MKTRRAFRVLVDDAIAEVSACWRLLEPSESLPDLLSFQPRLLKALQSLESEYNVLAETRRILVARKRKLAPKWLRHRLRLIAERQKILRYAITVGRTVGDTFAWLFYHNEQKLLDAHASHEMVVPVPTGIGGSGELAFIQFFQGMGGFLVLHHGITTILRLGDVSLVDVVRRHVVAIGEIKSHRVKEGELRLQVVLLPAVGEALNLDQLHKGIPRNNSCDDVPLEMSQEMVSRLRRQLGRTVDALRTSTEETIPPMVELEGTTYLPELTKAVRDAKRGQWTTHQAGRGLVFIVYRCSSRGFAARVAEFEERAKGRLAKGKDPSAAVARTLIPGAAYNAIVTASALYDKNGLPRHHRGGMPLLWLGLQRDLLFRLITGETAVVLAYNPAHLYRAFEARGWEMVRAVSPQGAVLRKRLGSEFAQLHRLQRFMNDVIHGLQSEETVVDAAEAAVVRAAASDIPRGTQIQLDVRHVLPPVQLDDGEIMD